MLRQITNLIERFQPAEYRTALPVLNGSSIGQHIRHVYDIYHCLAASRATGLIDYTARERHPLIESEPAFAKEMFQKLQASLHRIDEGQPVSVISDFSAKKETRRQVVASTLGREMMYAYDHAVHHLAILRIGIQSAFPAMEMDINLGVAPSTIKYRETRKTHPN